jgi:DNA invertase Pin-like site-specific DNA recombinase
MKAVGYIRVSKEEQAISGLGLEDQTSKIALYCQMKGLDLTHTYREEAVSGAKPLADRPEGAKLLDALKKSKAESCVIVLKLDRIFRNAQDCLATVEAWDNPKNGKQHVALHIIDLGGNSINTQSAAGKFMLTVLAGAAEMERNLISERTKAALDVKRKNGYKTGGKNPPYGFDAKRNGKLVENEDEQAVLAAMVELKQAGETYESITSFLNEQGIKSKTGKLWNPGTTYGVLSRHV